MTTTYYCGVYNGDVRCATCAGYALTESIKTARKNQKTFTGAQGSYFLMTREEVAHMQAVLDQDSICNC